MVDFAEDSSIPVIKNLTENFITKATKVMRSPKADLKKYEDLSHQLCLLEVEYFYYMEIMFIEVITTNFCWRRCW